MIECKYKFINNIIDLSFSLFYEINFNLFRVNFSEFWGQWPDKFVYLVVGKGEPLLYNDKAELWNCRTVTESYEMHIKSTEITPLIQ